MFELFTDSARKVLQLANQEAQYFNHEYIGPEEILLGLLKHDDNIACHVLRNLGVIPQDIYAYVCGKQASGGMVIMGKLPHTPRSKNVIEYAIAEARDFGHGYVGTEHILLGLLYDDESFACQYLNENGVTFKVVYDEIRDIMADVNGKSGPAGASFLEIEATPKGISMQLSKKINEMFISGCDLQSTQEIVLPFIEAAWNMGKKEGRKTP